MFGLCSSSKILLEWCPSQSKKCFLSSLNQVDPPPTLLKNDGIMERWNDGWKWLELAGNCWKWLEWLNIVGNGWKWLEMAWNDWNGWKWLDIMKWKNMNFWNADELKLWSGEMLKCWWPEMRECWNYEFSWNSLKGLEMAGIGQWLCRLGPWS